jgi:hypothetical protein
LVHVVGEAQGWQVPEEITGTDGPGGQALELLRIFESGLMSAGFDAGYITFNAIPVLESEVSEPSDQFQMFKLARDNDADLIISLKLLLEYDQATRQISGGGELSLIESHSGLVQKTIDLQSVTIANAWEQSESLGSDIILSSW